MENRVSPYIYRHLEYLGYEVEDKSEKDVADLLIGIHENKTNVFIQVTNDNSFSLTCSYDINDHVDLAFNPNDFFLLLNKVNLIARLTKWSYDLG